MQRTGDDSKSVEDSGDDDDDEDVYTKEYRKRSLEESGNWVTYLKSFSILTRYLILKEDRFVQFCMIVNIVCLISGRAFKILIPCQLGIIIDQVISGALPLADLNIWLLFSLLAGNSGLGLIQRLVRIPIEQFSYRQVTNAAFDHVMSLSVDFHNFKDSAEVMKAVEQGRSLNYLLEAICSEIAPSTVDVIISYVYIYRIFDIHMTAVLLTASAAYLYLDITMSNRNIGNKRMMTKTEREEAKVMQQAVQGWTTVAYFNQFGYEKSRFAKTVNSQLAASRNYVSREAWNEGIMAFIIPLAIYSMCSLALYQIARGEATPGDFVFLIQYWDTLMYPLEYLSSHYRWLAADLVNAERLLVLFQTKATITEHEDAKALRVVAGNVRFRDIHFSYDSRKSTLQGIDIDAPAGQTTALVGGTGAGKSSLLKLLYRFYDVTGGSVEIDGQDIRNVTISSLRDALGVVPQDPDLFNASVMENLRYAKMDATDEEVHAACQAAALHDIIMGFPDQYRSTVGERGVKLSGGELQRLAIARVLLKNPPIVLLDEATSAVETETELKIQAVFQRLSVGRTTFVIAHRLSTIVNAHQILVVEDGKIVERGTHHDLLRKKRKYSGLWTKQIAGLDLTETSRISIARGFKVLV